MPRTGLNISVRLTEEPAAPAVDRTRWLLIGLLLSVGLVVLVVGIRYFFMPPPPEAAVGMPHQNHRPQHGGAFFMAEDNIHHLEGVLIDPGTFRLYLYDAYTVGLPPEDVKDTHGMVEIGDTGAGKEIALKPSDDGRTLEANLGPKVSFPITLTVRLHLPGEAPDAKPELFTFPFSNYSMVTN